MYSGSTLKPLKRFDAWFGAHQKIDRAARQNLSRLLIGGVRFPNRKEIVRFEGIDGPDGIKRKTPAQDEPWHYFDPENADDTQLLEIIAEHYTQLVAALRSGNDPRASFEAAWLAHAVVDGLTPAHHYPYEEELIRLRGGEGIETRTSPKDKLVMPGDTLPQKLSNNWQMWGDKGLLATHIAFELGVAVLATPLRFKETLPTPAELRKVQKQGVQKLFVSRAQQIDKLQLYEQFYQSGWTPRLARAVRHELMPTIVNTVTLVWYAAATEATT
ncbi:MAG TPA: hypothetical protein VLE99_04395 [Candidatus Saccharimonadales bacterium]|nr:hypothetical protein [Candidatus Saccharimonadales bacterium]